MLKNSSSWGERQRAAQALGSLGATARSAASDLMMARIMDTDSDVRAAAARALSAVGMDQYEANEVLPQLVSMLNSNPNWSNRQRAARALGELGYMVRSAASDLLIAKVIDSDIDVRAAAAQALNSVGIDQREVDEALPRMVFMLRMDSSWGNRQRAAQALGELGPMARWATNDLMAAQATDSDADVRAAAAQALSMIIGPGGYPSPGPGWQHHGGGHQPRQ